MARLARIVVPGLPHHVTQRGDTGAGPSSLRMATTKSTASICWLSRRVKAEVAVWAYCLMPNHVHLIHGSHEPMTWAMPIGEAHRRYTNFINARGRWTGHLFQSRFASVVLDDVHLVRAVRYVSPCNPVRANRAGLPRP